MCNATCVQVAEALNFYRHQIGALGFCTGSQHRCPGPFGSWKNTGGLHTRTSLSRSGLYNPSSAQHLPEPIPLTWPVLRRGATAQSAHSEWELGEFQESTSVGIYMVGSRSQISYWTVWHERPLALGAPRFYLFQDFAASHWTTPESREIQLPLVASAMPRTWF